MSYFDKYVSFHFSYFDDSISGWSDLSSKQKLIMSLKILADSFGFLMILVITSEVINQGMDIIQFFNEIYSSSSFEKIPFLVNFSQIMRPKNPDVKSRVNSMSLKWNMANSLRPTNAMNVPIPAPVAFLELDISNLGCLTVTSSFCRHHLTQTR